MIVLLFGGFGDDLGVCLALCHSCMCGTKCGVRTTHREGDARLVRKGMSDPSVGVYSLLSTTS